MANEKQDYMIMPIKLHDFFAAAALVGVVANPEHGALSCKRDLDWAVEQAYELADRMMDVRSALPENQTDDLDVL